MRRITETRMCILADTILDVFAIVRKDLLMVFSALFFCFGLRSVWIVLFITSFENVESRIIVRVC